MKFRALTITLLLFGSLFASARGTISVKAHSFTDGTSTLLLKSMVKFRGVSKVLEKKVAAVELGNSPALGERRVFSTRAVAEILRQILGEDGLSNVRLIIPRKIVVENRGIVLNKKILQDKIQRQWEKLCRECQFRWDSISLPLVSNDVKGKRWKLQNIYQLPRKSFNYQLIFSDIDGRSDRSFWVKGNVTVLKKVLVTTRAISQMQSIDPSSVKMDYRDVTFAGDTSPTVKQVSGYAASRSFRAGEIIWHKNLVREKKIRRGSIVKAELKESAWKISLRVLAEEDGVVGQMIRVKSMATNKLMMGRVTVSGGVEIQ